MKSFRKYEFLPADWEKLKKDIQQIDGDETSWKDCAVVEIGFICLEWGTEDDKPVCTKQSDKWAVDILFYSEPPASFAPFEVFPNPCGVHTFSGDESLYLKTFCAKYPDSEYCKLPEPLINETV
jgi:hypothetical protein